MWEFLDTKYLGVIPDIQLSWRAYLKNLRAFELIDSDPHEQADLPSLRCLPFLMILAAKVLALAVLNWSLQIC